MGCSPQGSSVELSRQECWNGLPFPPPEDLPDPYIEPASPASTALTGGFSATEPPGKPLDLYTIYLQMRHCIT